jgi:hypothetical protein
MRKTMRKVTIVVPVLMTSCHVSLNWKMGPVIAHVATTSTASTNVPGRPTRRDVAFESRVKREWFMSCASDSRYG